MGTTVQVHDAAKVSGPRRKVLAGVRTPLGEMRGQASLGMTRGEEFEKGTDRSVHYGTF
jgi:hypothetical protein